MIQSSSAVLGDFIPEQRSSLDGTVPGRGTSRHQCCSPRLTLRGVATPGKHEAVSGVRCCPHWSGPLTIRIMIPLNSHRLYLFHAEKVALFYPRRPDAVPPSCHASYKQTCHWRMTLTCKPVRRAVPEAGRCARSNARCMPAARKSRHQRSDEGFRPAASELMPRTFPRRRHHLAPGDHGPTGRSLGNPS